MSRAPLASGAEGDPTPGTAIRSTSRCKTSGDPREKWNSLLHRTEDHATEPEEAGSPEGDQNPERDREVDRELLLRRGDVVEAPVDVEALAVGRRSHLPVVEVMRGPRRVADRLRRDRAHPVDSVVVPGPDVSADQSQPFRLGRRARELRNRCLSVAVGIEVDGWRVVVDVDLVPLEANVGLAGVAEDDDRLAGPVREQDLVVAVEDLRSHPRDTRSDGEDMGAVAEPRRVVVRVGAGSG